MRSFDTERSPRTPSLTALSRASVALTLIALTASCESCDKRGPAVRFHSDVHSPPTLLAPTDASADGPPPDVARFAPVTGSVPDANGASITVDGVTIAAPSGESFTQWLRVDLDQDGQAVEVVASRAGADGRARAPVVYRKVGGAYEAVALPQSDPSDARCADSSLRQTSPRSVVVSWRCPVATDPSNAAPFSEEQLLIGLAASPLARRRATLLPGALPDTALTLMLEGADLDGDGLEEIMVGLAAGRAGDAPRATARVVFFDRAGALARDTTEPAASLNANVSAARRALSTGRAGAAEALATLDDYLRLRRAFCAGSSLARVALDGARGFDCSGASPSSAAELYARTLVNLGETPAAEAQLVADTASDFGVVTSERVINDIDRASLVDRTVTARQGPFAGAALDAIAPGRVGSLVLNRATAPTAVTVRGPAGASVDLATLTLTQGAAGTIDDVFARSPDGATRVTGLVETCQGVAVVTCAANDEACGDATITESTSALPAGATKTALPVLPSFAFSQSCVQNPSLVKGLSASRGRVLGYGRDGLVVAVHGLLYRVAAGGVARVALGDALGAGFAAGSAVSEGGAALVVAGRSGLWVRERSAWRRWAPASLAGRFAQMTDFSVSNDARTLVGLVGTELWVLERPRAPARRR